MYVLTVTIFMCDIKIVYNMPKCQLLQTCKNIHTQMLYEAVRYLRVEQVRPELFLLA